MTYGMSYEQFWNGDLYIAEAFREYKELLAERTNQELWLAGLYTFNAVNAAVQGALWNGKGRRPDGYLDRPIPMTEREQREEQERKKKRTLDWVKKGQE